MDNDNDIDDYESLPEGTSFAVFALAGSLAGIGEHCLMYPFDVIKTRMQCLNHHNRMEYHSLRQGMKRMIHMEGFKTSFRGISTVVLGAGPAHAAYFSTYEYIRRYGTKNAGESTMMNAFAGMTATIVHDGLMNPTEVVKQRIQMTNKNDFNIFQLFKKILRDEGFSTFYRSYSTQLTMNIPFHMTHVMVYEASENYLNPLRQYSPITHCLSGAVGGAFAAAITTPLDVCKTIINTKQCCQLNKMKCQKLQHLQSTFHERKMKKFGKKRNFIFFKQFNNFVHMQNTDNPRNLLLLSRPPVNGIEAMKHIYAGLGVRGFLLGMKARIIFQMPGTAISWIIYESFKHLFLPQSGNH
ncbi:hypothetical protein SNEBB_002620 [Seison nebaliae]|nr:hypothetical protein SNEBB_002620 [Seison nebaliae]